MGFESETVCYHYTIRKTVMERIELSFSDRQSDVLAITPHDHKTSFLHQSRCRERPMLLVARLESSFTASAISDLLRSQSLLLIRYYFLSDNSGESKMPMNNIIFGPGYPWQVCQKTHLIYCAIPLAGFAWFSFHIKSGQLDLNQRHLGSRPIDLQTKLSDQN